jgi:hypothetical protein
MCRARCAMPDLRGTGVRRDLAPNFFYATGSGVSTKQMLLAHSDSDIAQKHPASRFTRTTGRGGQWNLSDEGETNMTSVVVSDAHEIRELTVEELDEAGGGLTRQEWITVGAFVAGIIVGVLL